MKTACSSCFPLVEFDFREGIVMLQGYRKAVTCKALRDLYGQNAHYITPCGVRYDEARYLYLACKDAYSSKGPINTNSMWRADLTVYPPEPLPTLELNRSIGHRNGPLCAEVFEVWQGKVRMYSEGVASGQAASWYCDLVAGDCLEIPQGHFHSTHVIEGPAVVFNIYSGQSFFRAEDKPYYVERGGFTFAWSGNSIASVKRPEAYLDRPEPVCIECTDRCSSLGGFSSVVDFFLHSTDDARVRYRAEFLRRHSTERVAEDSE